MSYICLPAIKLNVKKGCKLECGKMKIYKNYLNCYDWILKTDDDTLRYYEKLTVQGFIARTQ